MLSAALPNPCDDPNAVIRPPVEADSGLAAVLRGVIADFQHASGAEIVSVFLHEESTHTYYAPFATGQPQESLLDSLTDMNEQLARYLNDERQGKVPDELGVHQYGSTVWLTVTRQRLVARNAQAEIDSTFIRRYQVQSTIGLPPTGSNGFATRSVSGRRRTGRASRTTARAGSSTPPARPCAPRPSRPPSPRSRGTVREYRRAGRDPSTTSRRDGRRRRTGSRRTAMF